MKESTAQQHSLERLDFNLSTHNRKKPFTAGAKQHPQQRQHQESKVDSRRTGAVSPFDQRIVGGEEHKDAKRRRSLRALPRAGTVSRAFALFFFPKRGDHLWFSFQLNSGYTLMVTFLHSQSKGLESPSTGIMGGTDFNCSKN